MSFLLAQENLSNYLLGELSITTGVQMCLTFLKNLLEKRMALFTQRKSLEQIENICMYYLKVKEILQNITQIKLYRTFTFTLNNCFNASI